MFFSKSPKSMSSHIVVILVTVLLLNSYTKGSFPSEWTSNDRCTYNFGYLCVDDLQICAVTCYQYQSNNVYKSWPLVKLLGGSAETTFDFVRGSGDASSFTYIDVYDNTDYRCSQGSLKNEVFLLRELDTGVTSATTEAQCETLGVSQLDTRILPKFGTPGDEDSKGKSAACPLSGEYSFESVSSTGPEVSGNMNFTGDHFQISFSAGVDEAGKTVNGFVLDSTDFFCVDNFPGDFINGDNSTALVFFYNSSEVYATTNGNSATRYQYRGARYSHDESGNIMFSMYLGGATNESFFMHEHLPTTTGADYATYKLSCSGFGCPDEIGVCLSESNRLDGSNDCLDGSDEKSADCCLLPESHIAKWYYGRDVPQNDGNRPYMLHTVNSDGCSVEASRAFNNPDNAPANSLTRKCGRNGATINGHFYLIEHFINLFWRCSSAVTSSNGDLRFERISSDLASFSNQSSPQECAADIGDSTNFQVSLNVPLINSSHTVSVPWTAGDMTQSWQTSIKQTSGQNLCSGDSSSTITFTSNSIDFKLCQITSIPAVGIDETDVSMRVIRTWSVSDMGGMGDDSLGTFLLLGLNDQTQLDQNSVHLYTARFLKKSSVSYLAIDWTQTNVYPVDAAMNPETVHTTNADARVYEVFIDAPVETSTEAMETTVASVADCCLFPNSLKGEWYWGRGKLSNSKRPFSESKVASDGCSTLSQQTYDDPSGTPFQALNLKCENSGQMIGDSFYVIDYLLSLYTCRSFTPAGELRFERISSTNDGAPWSASSTPTECKAEVESSTIFRVQLQVPLVSNSSPVTVPWTSTLIGKPLQASVKKATGANTCAGMSSSTITLTSDSIQMKLCQRTNIPAVGIDEENVDMKVIRTWSGSDMGSLGDDSLGTFLLLALNDPTQLATNSPHLYTARFVKTGAVTYALAVNWIHDSFFPVDATMNPNIFSTDADVRVYDLVGQAASSTSEPATEPSASQVNAIMPSGTMADEYSTSTVIQTDSAASEKPSGTLGSNAPSGTETPSKTMGSDAPSRTDAPSETMGSMPSGTQPPEVSPTSGASNIPSQSQGSDATQTTATAGQMTIDTDPSAEQTAATQTGAIQPTPTSAPVTQDTTTPGDGIQPTATSETPESTAAADGQVGVAVVTVDGDFDTITGGDAPNYCQQTEPQIALKADVAQNRVDNVQCEQGSVKITTHISEGNPGETTIEQALENLKDAVAAGFMVTGPDGQEHPVNPNAFEQYISHSNGTLTCRSSTCNQPTGPAAQTEEGNNNILIYCLVGVGVVIIIATVIAVFVCAMKRQEPSSFKKMPFEEEDGFGMVKQWQANYKLSLKR